MSSPNVGSRKTTKTGAAKSSAPKTAKSGKAAAKPATKSRARAVDADGLTGEDRVNFVKAMWEGVAPKGDKASGSKKPAGKATGSKASGGSRSKEEAPKVEILRKISAPVRDTSPQSAESQQALALARALENKLADGDLAALSPEAVQALMTVICKLYGANHEFGNKYPILGGRAAVTGTDVMIACGALLKAVDLQVFELGMWQSWSGS